MRRCGTFHLALAGVQEAAENLDEVGAVERRFTITTRRQCAVAGYVDRAGDVSRTSPDPPGTRRTRCTKTEHAQMGLMTTVERCHGVNESFVFGELLQIRSRTWRLHAGDALAARGGLGRRVGSSTTATSSWMNTGAMRARSKRANSSAGMSNDTVEQTWVDQFVGDREHLSRAIDIAHVLAAITEVGGGRTTGSNNE